MAPQVAQHIAAVMPLLLAVMSSALLIQQTPLRIGPNVPQQRQMLHDTPA
jgi:hypothetical protein